MTREGPDGPRGDLEPAHHTPELRQAVTALHILRIDVEMVITTEVGVAEAPKKKDAGHSHGMPGGMGDPRGPQVTYRK